MFGPGLEKSGCLVHQPAEFTVNAKDAGNGPLKIMAQVSSWMDAYIHGWVDINGLRIDTRVDEYSLMGDRLIDWMDMDSLTDKWKDG